MDDCSIFTKKGEEDLHRQITADFFDTLRQNNLFLKPSKCTFEKRKIDFLSLRVTPEGLTIDPGKVAAIKDWPINPKNIKELRSVLGVLGYQRPFIPGFAKIARPLTKLLKKDVVYQWTEECRKALDSLINMVCSSPVLAPPDQDRQFELEVYASQYALGGILWQRDPTTNKLRAVGYFSKTLSPAQQNY